MKKIRKFTKSKIIEKLWRTVALLDNPREVRQFLEDILYPSEVSMLGQRLLVALLLRRGLTYEQIEVRTGASTGTINRVWQVMHRGTGGYELAFSTYDQKKIRDEYERREYALDPTDRYIKRRLRKGK